MGLGEQKTDRKGRVIKTQKPKEELEEAVGQESLTQGAAKPGQQSSDESWFNSLFGPKKKK